MSKGKNTEAQKSEVLQGTLDLMVLKVLDALGTQHGYGIARRIEQVSEQVLQLNEGTVYTSLLRLQQRGWIDSDWGTSENNRKAKYYSITKSGRKQLEREGELGADRRRDRAPVEAGRPGVEMTHYLRALAARLRGLFGDRRVDRELNDEIEAHLRLLTERYVRQGMTSAEAALAARRQFGNVTLLREEHRDMRGIRLIDTLFQVLAEGSLASSVPDWSSLPVTGLGWSFWARKRSI
jgi:PadR family transcriptional regulator